MFLTLAVSREHQQSVETLKDLKPLVNSSDSIPLIIPSPAEFGEGARSVGPPRGIFESK